MDMFDRLKQFIVSQGFTVASFERKIGVSNATISKAIERKKGISTDVLVKILETFLSLNPDWILLGNGEMLRQNEQNVPQIDPLYMVSLEKYEKKVEECALLRAELNALKEHAAAYAKEKTVSSGTTTPVEV